MRYYFIILCFIFLYSCCSLEYHSFDDIKDEHPDKFILIDKIIQNPDSLESCINEYGYDEYYKEYQLMDSVANSELKEYIKDRYRCDVYRIFNKANKANYLSLYDEVDIKIIDITDNLDYPDHLYFVFSYINGKWKVNSIFILPYWWKAIYQ
jgi:hypothetical protein